MKCMNCGAELTDSAYCPKCGCDVSVQKQAIVLSGLYYNQGLEKAQVRDLSGAIDQLKRSLKFNKLNVPARNLLGLVYFETGEVVAALSEWVISKNIQPEDNIAAEYIRILQQDANRLDIINQTIKKYNIALENCLEGNEDVALIQLKKILAQNPKLIKGYHLLALLYIHKKEYEKARRLLKKAIRIDRTNTTTLRFLHEVDEQTGTATSLESRFPFRGNREPEPSEPDPAGSERTSGSPAFFRANGGTRSFSFLNVLLGALIGAAAIWFLFIPAYTKNINRAANEKITRYSSDMAVYASQIQTMNDQIKASQETVDTAKEKIEAANAKSSSYDNLISAQNAYNNGTYDTAAEALADIDASQLSAEAKSVYDGLSSQLKDYLMAAYKKVGLEAFSKADYASAITKLEAARAIDASDYDVLNYLAHAYRLSGNQDKADEIFTQIVQTFPNSTQSENAMQYLSDAAKKKLSSASSDAADGTAAAAETKKTGDDGNTDTNTDENSGDGTGDTGDNDGGADEDQNNTGEDEDAEGDTGGDEDGGGDVTDDTGDTEDGNGEAEQ